MSSGQYMLGIALLGVTVGSLVATARVVRRMILPAWSGAPARLAEAVIGIAALVVVSELLGAVGVFTRWWLAGACAVIAIGTLAVLRTRVPARGGSVAAAGADLAAPSAGVLPVAAAAVAVALTLVPWKDGTLAALHHGMSEYDTLAYHMPFAARFAQDASVTGIQYVWNDPVSFYPANSELIHAVGIVLFGRDLLSPVLNLGWLGLALLAGWCIGRPWGIGPATMSATALVASVNVMVFSQAGSANNDIAGLAFVLAAVAFVVSAPRLRGAQVLAALAAGLAVGTRLSLWAPVLALSVMAIVGAGRGHRRATAAMVDCGGRCRIGLLVRPQPGRHRQPAAMVRTEARRTAEPPLHRSITDWVDVHRELHRRIPPSSRRTSFRSSRPRSVDAGGSCSCWPSPELAWAWRARAAETVRPLAFVVLASAVAYVFTPATAAGPAARLFAYNTRYAVPAIALGVIVLVLALSRLGVQPLGLVLGMLLAVIVVVPFHLSAAVLVAVVLAVTTTAVVVFGARAAPRRARGTGLVFVLLGLAVVVGVGWREQRTYLHDRYRGATLGEPVEPIYAALAGVSHARIAVAGFAEAYPLYGVTSTNRVDYPSSRSQGTRFTLRSDCSSWLLALSEGHYDYVVTARQGPGEPSTAVWTLRYPGAHELLASPPGFVRGGSAWRWELFRLPRAAGVNTEAACRGT